GEETLVAGRELRYRAELLHRTALRDRPGQTAGLVHLGRVDQAVTCLAHQVVAHPPWSAQVPGELAPLGIDRTHWPDASLAGHIDQYGHLAGHARQGEPWLAPDHRLPMEPYRASTILRNVWRDRCLRRR